MFLEELWVKLDVSGLVDTMDVTKSSSNREVWADLLECGVDIVDVFGLSVK